MGIRSGAMLLLLLAAAGLLSVARGDCESDPCSHFATCTNDPMQPPENRNCSCDAGTSAGNGEICVDDVVLSLNGSTTTLHAGVHRVVIVEANFTVPEFEAKVEIDFTVPQAGGMDAFVMQSGVMQEESSDVTNSTLLIASPQLGENVTSVAVVGPSLNADEAAVAASNQKATMTVQFAVLVRAEADGGTLSFSVTATYTQDESQVQQSTASVEFAVEEPTLEHSLTPQGVTTELDAGDEVVFELVVGHVSGTSDAAAYDVVTSVSYDAGVGVLDDASLTCGGAACGRTTVSVDNETLTLTVTAARLEEAEALMITFTGVMAPVGAVRPGANYSLAVATTYDSSPRDSGAYTGRSYSVSPDVVLLETGLGSLDPFAHIGDSIAQTVHPMIALDESVTYRVGFELPSGRSMVNLTVAWDVPGFIGQSSVVSLVGTAVTTTGLPESSAGVLVGAGAYLFDFGRVTVEANQGAGARRIEVDVTIATPADVASLGEGDVLVVNSTLLTDGYEFAETTSVTVVEASMTLTREVARAVSVVDAADVFSFSGVVSHLPDSAAPGYDIVVEQELDPLLSFSSYVCEPISCSVVEPSGSMLMLMIGEVPLGMEVELYWNATVNQEVRPDDVIIDAGQTRLVFNTSGQFSGAREYEPVVVTHTGQQLSTVFQPSVSLQFDRTSFGETLDRNVAIHEEIAVRILLTLPEVTTDAIFSVWYDFSPLDAGLLDPAVSVFSAGNILRPDMGGVTLSAVQDQTTFAAFSSSTLVNYADNELLPVASNVLEVDFVFRIPDDANLDSLSTLHLNASVDYDGGRVYAAESITFTVVTPDLMPSFAIDETNVDAGDLQVYTMTLDNDGTGPAYDVLITGIHDAGVVPLPGTVVCSVCSASNNPLNDTVDGYEVLAYVPVVLNGQTLQLSWNVNFTSDTEVRRDESYQVTAASRYDTSVERVGSYVGRELTTVQQTQDVSIPASTHSISFVADSLTSSAPSDGSNLAVDEFAVFEVQVQVHEGSSQLVLECLFQRNMLTGLWANVTSVDGDVSVVSLGAAGDTATQESNYANIGGIDFDAFVFDFGETTHLGTRQFEEATITVRFSVFVDSEKSAAQAGTSPYIRTRLYDDSSQVDQMSQRPLVREPQLIARNQGATRYRGDGCDNITYEYQLSPNTGVSFSDAFALVVNFTYDVRQQQHDSLFFSCISDTSDAPVTVTGTSCTASTEATTHEYHDGYVLVRAAHLRQSEVLRISSTAALLQVVEPEENLENVISVQYDSSNVPAPFDGRLYTPSSLTLNTEIDRASVSISVSATSDDETSGRELTIEEEAVILIRFEFPEVTSFTRLQIDIPINMEFLNATVAHLGDNILNSNVQEGDGFDGVNWLYDSDARQVIATLGTITNDCDGAETVDDQIEILVGVRLRDIPGNVGLHRATSFDMYARAHFPSTKDGERWDDRTLEFTVVEPEIENAVSSSVSTSTTNDAGDTIVFTIDVNHAGGSTAVAYRTVTHVHIEPQYTLDAGSITFTYSGALATPSVNQVNSTYFQIILESLELGRLLQVTYTVQVNQNVRPEQVVTSYIETQYTSTGSSFSQDGRIHDSGAEYPPADNTVNVTMDAVQIVTTVVSTSLPETPALSVNIHEEVTFEIEVTLPEVTTQMDVVFRLDNAAGFTYRNASVVSVGANVQDAFLATGEVVSETSEVRVDFVFGEVYNAFDNVPNSDDTVVLRVIAQIDDSSFSDAGDSRYGNAAVNFDALSARSEASVAITEPTVDLSVGLDKLHPLDAGDVVTYTVDLPFVSESTSCIYDMTTTLVVSDTLDIVGADLGTVASTVNISADLKTVSWSTPLYTFSESLVFTFRAVILNKVIPNEQNLIASAQCHYDSHRDSIWGRGGREYEFSAVSPVITVDQPIILYSSIDSSLPLTAFPDDLAIHESVTVQANVTLPESTTRAIVTLSPSTADLDAWVLQDRWFEVGGKLNCTTMPIFSDTDALTFTGNDTVTFDFGVCLNAFDNVQNDSDRLQLYAVFAPIDHRPTVVDGRSVSLTAQLDYSYQTLNNLNQRAPGDLVYRVVEPNLTTRIGYAAAEPVDAGDVVTYTITTAHNGESTAAAHDLVLVAEVHPDLGIVAADGGSHGAAHSIANNSKTVTFRLKTLPLTDPVLVVTFDAVVLNSMVPTEIKVVALHNVSYDSHLNATRFGLSGRLDERENVSLPVQIADLAIASQLLLTSDDNTELFNLAVHETYTSAVTVTLPELTTNVTVESDFVVDNVTWLVDFEYQVGERIVCTIPRPEAQYRDDDDDGVYDGVLLDFGVCENQRDNVADRNDQIVLTTVALVRDVAAAQTGQQLQQTARVVYTKDLVTLLGSHDSNALNYTVVEPVVELVMDVLSLDPADAGDTVKYGLTLTHLPASTASCYDLTFTAEVHPMLGIVAADGGPLGAAANVSEDALSVTFTLSELALATGTTYVTFDAVIQNDVYPNAAAFFSRSQVQFDTFLLSIFGQAGRTDMLNTTSPEINVAEPRLSIKLFNTSDALTDGDHVAINELYILRARARLPEVTTRVLLDIDFAASMTASWQVQVQRMWAVVGDDLACASPAAMPQLSSNNTRAVFDLGVCVNRFDNALTSGDLVDLYVEVHVPDVPSNDDGDVLPATAHLNYTDSTNTSANAAVDTALSVQIVEPTMSINLTQPANAFVRRSQVVPLHVRMTPSFGHDVVVTVTLPEYLHYDSVMHVQGARTPQQTDITNLSGGGTVIEYHYGSVPDDALLEMDVVTRVDAQAPGARALDVTVDLAYDSSPRPGLGRPYNDSAMYRTLYVVLLDMITGLVTNDATTADGDLAIQEEVTFNVNLGIKGPSALVITFDLPTESGSGEPLLSLVSASVGEIGVNIEARDGQVLNVTEAVALSPTQAQMDFGEVANLIESSALSENDTLHFNLTFLVLDASHVVSRVQDDMLIAAAFAGLSVQTDTQVRIVEPLLASLAAISPQDGDAGDAFTLSYSVWHTQASSHSAYAMTVVASMDAGLRVVPSQGSLVLTDGSSSSVNVTVAADGLSLATQLPELPLGVNATMEIVMQLDTNVTLATRYGTLVPLVYESRLVTPRRRAESFATASMQTDAMDTPALALMGSTGGYAGTGNDSGVPMLTTGEQISMSLVLPLREGLMTDLVSELSFPLVNGQPVLAVVSANVTRAGEQLDISSQQILPRSVPGGSSRRRRAAFSADDAYVGVEFRFGEVLNTPDNVANASDEIEVNVVGQVLDTADLPTNVSVALSTSLASDGSSNGAGATVFILRPSLNMSLPGPTLSVKSYVNETGEKPVTMTYVEVPVSVYHANDSALLAANVQTTLNLSGSATFTRWSNAPMLMNATQPTHVSSFELEDEPMVVTEVLLVDRALNPSGVELCLDAGVAYTTPSARQGGPVSHLQVSGRQCSELLFPAPSQSFLETLQGQLIVYIAAALAFVVIVLASVMVARKRIRAAKEKSKASSEVNSIGDDPPVPPMRSRAPTGTSSEEGGRAYVDPETGEVHHAYDYVANKQGEAVYGKAGANADYADAEIAREADEDDDYALAARDESGDEVYDRAGKRPYYTQGDADDEDDYALAAKYDQGDADDEDDYALAAKYDQGDADDEDDYALAAKYDRGDMSDEDDYALAAKYGGGSDGAMDDGDYQFANQVGAKRRTGGKKVKRRSKQRHSSDDYALALHQRRGAEGSSDDDIYGMANGGDDTYGLAGDLLSSSGEGDDEDDTYGLADVGASKGKMKRKKRNNNNKERKGSDMDNDETAGRPGDLDDSEEADDDAEEEDDYSFAGKVRKQSKRRQHRPQHRDKESSEDDYGMAGDVFSHDNATGDDANDTDDDDPYNVVPTSSTSNKNELLPQGGDSDSNPDPVYSRVQK